MAKKAKAEVVKVEPIPEVMLQPIATGFDGALTAETFPLARTAWAEAKAEVAKRKAYFEGLKKPLNELRAKILEAEKQSVGFAQARVDVLGKMIQQFQDALEAARREAERKAREEAEQAAALERQKQIEALKAAQAAAPAEHKEIIAQQVEAVQQAPLRVVPSKPAMLYGMPTAPLVPERTTYSGEVVDFAQLVMQIGARAILRWLEQDGALPVADLDAFGQLLAPIAAGAPSNALDYLLPNGPAINKLAGECGGTMPLRGVRSVEHKSLVNRAAKAAPTPIVACDAVEETSSGDDAMRF